MKKSKLINNSHSQPVSIVEYQEEELNKAKHFSKENFNRSRTQYSGDRKSQVIESGKSHKSFKKSIQSIRKSMKSFRTGKYEKVPKIENLNFSRDPVRQ